MFALVCTLNIEIKLILKKTEENKVEKLVLHCDLVGTYQRVVVNINKITLEIE